MSTLEHQYRSRRESVLVPLADALQAHIADLLRGVERIDRVSARAKTVKSFLDKAATVDVVTGNLKYQEPLEEIQDQVGARVTVFYLPDVDRIDDIVRRYFTFIESKNLIPESEWQFGYFGRHFLVNIPADFYDIRSQGEGPHFFELQIKTLFQHAWSEANHDLGYKPGSITLEPDEARSLAFTSAQAWGADRIFRELFEKRQAAR